MKGKTDPEQGSTERERGSSCGSRFLSLKGCHKPFSTLEDFIFLLLFCGCVCDFFFSFPT